MPDFTKAESAQADSSHVDFAQELVARLQSPLLMPARQASRRAFSPELSYGRHFAPASPDCRAAAVMVLLEPRDGTWTIPLTVRPQHLPDHPGQISFPGGRLEATESAEDAAKREFEEELGVAFQGTILGELQPIFVYNSNYAVRPFVAISEQSFQYTPCAREVARIVHLPVSKLNDSSAHTQAEFRRGTVLWQSKVIEVGQDQVWGATAIMLGELAAIVKNVF